MAKTHTRFRGQHLLGLGCTIEIINLEVLLQVLQKLLNTHFLLFYWSLSGSRHWKSLEIPAMEIWCVKQTFSHFVNTHFAFTNPKFDKGDTTDKSPQSGFCPTHIVTATIFKIWLGHRHPKWPLMAAPRKMELNELMQGIDHGQKMLKINSFGSIWHVSFIQDHFVYWNPRQLFWWCVLRHEPPDVIIR